MQLKIYVPLEPIERDGLNVLAEHEKRDVRDQAALIIRRELERLGYVQPPQMEAIRNGHDAQPT